MARTRSQTMYPLRRLLMALGCLLALRAPLGAQLPGARLLVLNPPGGKQGTTFDVTVSGADLDDALALRFGAPGITATRKLGAPGPFDRDPPVVPGVFTVTITPQVPPGITEVRLVGRFGVSNPRAFQVLGLTEVPEKEPNNDISQAVPTAPESVNNGVIGGGADIDCFRFPLKTGQRIFVDCHAQRLDSRLDAVLVLCGAAGNELLRSRDSLRRDPLLDFTAPADGDYVVKIYDAVYGGSPEHFYRLEISSRPKIDFVLPAAVVPGGKAQLSLYGRGLPGGQPVPELGPSWKGMSRLPVDLEVPALAAGEALLVTGSGEGSSAATDGIRLQIPGALASEPPVVLGVATAPVILEAEPNNAPEAAQKLPQPCEVSAQFYPQNDEDWFTLEMTAGEVLVVEVIAQRLGLIADPFLLLQFVKKNEKGEDQVQELQAMDDLGGNVGGAAFDTGSEDSGARVQAPANGTLRIFVRDQYSTATADPRNVYRLSVRKESPDFRLLAVPRFPAANPDPAQNRPGTWTPLLRRGGSDVVDLYLIRRDGFAGEVQVNVSGLPSSVQCPGATIGPGATTAPLVFTAADDAPEWIGTLEIVGTARVGDAQILRHARAGAMVWPGVDNTIGARSRVVQEFVLGVTREAAQFTLATAGRVEMSRAGTLSLPVTLKRAGDFKGAVAVTAPGLPPNVAAKPLTLEPALTAGQLELSVQPGAPLGSFTFHLQGTSQVSYARNPEAPTAAGSRKTALEQAAAEAAAALKVATEAKAAAEKAAGEAAQALAKASEAQAKTAGEGKAAADQVKAAAEEVKKLADQARAQAEKAFQDAESRARLSTEAVAAAGKALEAAQALAKPQNVNVAFASGPVTLRVAPSPVELEVFAPSLALKPGQRVDVPVVVTRLFGFADPVTVTATPPQGVPGLTAQPLTLAAGQRQGVLAISAGPDTPPGDHSFTFTATAKLGGQDLQTTRTFPLKLEKP